MPLKVPLVSEKYILNTFLNSASWRLRLFKRNYTPVSGSLLADFTAANEADFSGYAAVVLNAGTWTPAADDGSGRAICFYPSITFANTTGLVGNDIYGYFVTDNGGVNLLWAERFATVPVNMQTAGKTMFVTPVFTLLSEF